MPTIAIWLGISLASVGGMLAALRDPSTLWPVRAVWALCSRLAVPAIVPPASASVFAVQEIPSVSMSLLVTV